VYLLILDIPQRGPILDLGQVLRVLRIFRLREEDCQLAATRLAVRCCRSSEELVVLGFEVSC